MLNLNDNESIIAFSYQITITYVHVHVDTRVASYVVFLSLRFITDCCINDQFYFNLCVGCTVKININK